MPKKNKTRETEASVIDFVNAIGDEAKLNDSLRLIEIIKKMTGFEPKMWGPSIIGFGSYHYRYTSGHEGDAPLIGFSPRKDAITIYLCPAYEGMNEMLKRLGKHKAGKGCIYIKRLEDVNILALKEIIAGSTRTIKRIYPSR